MSVQSIYASSGSGNYLKEADLGGRTHKVEIESTEIVTVKDDSDNDIEKLCVKFRGRDKTLLLNKTNAKAIAAVLGDDENGWIGNTIIMFPTTCEFQGNTVPCIRVRGDEVIAEDGEVPF